MRTIIKASWLTLLSVPLFLAVFLSLFILPVDSINRLKSEFVSMELTASGPYYEITKERPTSWVSLELMDYTSIHAIVVSEDWGFYQHNGIDFRQIYIAVMDTVKKGRSLRGASTITQQVVKNLFLTNEKNLWRKIKEAFLAVSIELALPKEKILEVYLNIIEYGEGIYGIHQAAQYYFNKEPLYLTPREGAFLATVLPSPKKSSAAFQEGKLSIFVSKTIDQILGKMVVAKYLSRYQMGNERMKKFGFEDPNYFPDIYSL